MTLHLSTVNVEGWLTPEQELHVYRVVQEALANTARHARAASVTIDIGRATDALQATDRLIVTVHDDGVGFDPTAPAQGIGLVTMRERGMLLHGTVTIDSAPGRGTTVRVVLPLAIGPVYAEEAAAPVTAASDSRARSTQARRRRSRKCSISTSFARRRTWRASRSSSSIAMVASST
jgi:signal transduction histidine kinase